MRRREIERGSATGRGRLGKDTPGITLLNSTANEKCLFSKFNLPRRRLVDVVITPPPTAPLALQLTLSPLFPLLPL